MNRRFAYLILAAVALAAACAGSHAVLPGAPQPSQMAVSSDHRATPPRASFEWARRSPEHMTPTKTAALGVMNVDVIVRMRDATGLLAYANSVSEPGSPNYRHFLEPSEIADRFAATKADYAAVTAYFAGYGMHVSGYPQREMLEVTGTAAQVSKAFNTPFVLYRDGNGAGTGPARTPSFTRALPVTAVLGLADAATPSLIGPIRAPVGAFSGYTPRQIALGFGYAGAYAMGYDGKGVTTGVVSVGPYNPADITAYAATYAWKMAKVVTVTPSPIPGRRAIPPTTNDQAGEPAIDSQAVAGLAPGATMDIVFDGNVKTLGIRQLADEVQLAIARNQVDVLSLSESVPEPAAAAAGVINTKGTGYWQMTAASLVAEGIALFASSGDDGSTPPACTYDYQLAYCVGYPASDPNVVAVGAVNTPLDGAGNVNGEITAWADNTTNGGDESPPPAKRCKCVGSGGGYSTFAKAPPWQRKALKATWREVPDIAMNGDPRTPGAIVVNGAAGRADGTSYATPQSAAIWGLVLQACKSSAKCATATGAKPYRLGNPAPLFYQIYRGVDPGGLKYQAVVYDVIHGNNTDAPPPSPLPSPAPSMTPFPSPLPSPIGCSAGPGYASSGDRHRRTVRRAFDRRGRARRRRSIADRTLTPRRAARRRRRAGRRAARRSRREARTARRRSSRRNVRRESRRALPSGAARPSISRQRGASVSRATTSRKTMPQRAEQIARERVRDRSPSSSEASSVQRPLDERGRARSPFSPRRRLASISERSASKPSAVTKPAATSCQSASSTSAGSRFVPRTMSAKNGAPRRSISARTSRAACDRPRGSLRVAHDQLFGIRSRETARSARASSGVRARVRSSCDGSSAGCARDAAPHHLARIAELIEELALVARDALR